VAVEPKSFAFLISFVFFVVILLYIYFIVIFKASKLNVNNEKIINDKTNIRLG